MTASGADGGSESILRSSRNLALSTLVSRILGFFREILTAAVIGGGALMSAWVLASTFANLFRRILGEGELGKVLVPIVTHTLDREGKDAARRKFSTLLVYLTLLLAVIAVVVSTLSLVLLPFASTERWRLAFQLTPLVMPYTVFICIVGIMTAYANSLRDFFLPSLTAIVQNLTLIAALALICIRLTGAAKLDVLALAILVSGALEILLMVWVIRRRGMAPRFTSAVWKDFATLREIFRLALPGLIGASALQVSLLVDRSIAGWLSDYAAPALYNSDRLIYLPIGIFAVSFATVANTEMSHAAAGADLRKLSGTLFFTLRVLLFITIPMAAFMYWFGPELIRLFYYRGAFSEEAVTETVFAFRFYTFGIPAFAAYKLSVAGFTARKDMLTPLYVSLFCIGLNIVLNLILMWPLRQGGIALATVISSYMNNFLLLILLRKQLGAETVSFAGLGTFLLKVALPATVAVVLCRYVYDGIAVLTSPFMSGGAAGLKKYLLDFGIGLIPMAGAGLIFGLIFLGGALALRLEEARVFARRFLRVNL